MTPLIQLPVAEASDCRTAGGHEVVALCFCSNSVPKTDRLITGGILLLFTGLMSHLLILWMMTIWRKNTLNTVVSSFFCYLSSINSSSGRRSVYHQFYRDFRLNLKNRHIFSIQTARHPDTMLQVDNSATCTARISPSK